MIWGISAVWPYFSRFQLFHHLISHLNPYPAATPWIIFYHPQIFHGIGEGGRRYKGVVEANYLWFASSLPLVSGPRLDYKYINVKSLYLWKEKYCSNYGGVKKNQIRSRTVHFRSNLIPCNWMKSIYSHSWVHLLLFQKKGYFRWFDCVFCYSDCWQMGMFLWAVDTSESLCTFWLLYLSWNYCKCQQILTASPKIYSPNSVMLITLA